MEFVDLDQMQTCDQLPQARKQNPEEFVFNSAEQRRVETFSELDLAPPTFVSHKYVWEYAENRSLSDEAALSSFVKLSSRESTS